MNTFKVMVVLFIVTLLGKSAMAQGVYGGTKEHPMTAAYGDVQKIIDKGIPLKLEATKIEVKFSDIYYEAVAESGGLFKPTSGEAQTVVIGDFKVELASKDFSKGFLDTKDFGKIALFVIPNMMGPDRWIMAVTDEQLKKIQAKVKKKEAVAVQRSLSDVKPGLYRGSAKEVETFSVILVSTNDMLKVSEVGYKFTASLKVEHAFLKTKKPFGSIEKNKLRFQFPVFVKFSPSSSLTSEGGGSTTMAYYSAEIGKIDASDELECKLTQIDKVDKEYEEFTFEDIGLRTPDKKMQKDYTITLKRVVK